MNFGVTINNHSVTISYVGPACGTHVWVPHVGPTFKKYQSGYCNIFSGVTFGHSDVTIECYCNTFTVVTIDQASVTIDGLL